MWMDLVGTWSGALSLAVILICAVGIPGAVVIALMRQVKGPIELAHEPTVSAVKHTAWHDQRYAHD
ncbi:hypothetical protein DFR26_0747 [Paraperlucidibaca baekdonensis]|uniref:Uncharacterized protein n=1 Tax=Paraperlucidibaca baekdonensis TaxID=748120 RepID=A0A3E0HA14_9GAMM|nr:hypothetical protein [Paraperlucidibaca baekdonensis]REH40546.1 hypothetical protein DFR26_0747 [Paraperlucidibaca baekdonensis]